jgi:hypothetical protein
VSGSTPASAPGKMAGSDRSEMAGSRRPANSWGHALLPVIFCEPDGCDRPRMGSK